jgi:hypothetical protein
MSRELRIVVDLSDWRAPRFSPWAKRLFLGGALFALLAPKAGSQLEDVQLNAYFPAQMGVYQQLMTSGNAYLATNNASGAGFVEIGSPGGTGTPTASVTNAALAVASGNVGVGTINPAATVHLGTGGPGGAGSVQLDNQNGSTGQVAPVTLPYGLFAGSPAWAFWANDGVMVGANTSYPAADFVQVNYAGSGVTDVTVGGGGNTAVSGYIFGDGGGAQLSYNPTRGGGNVPYCPGMSSCQASQTWGPYYNRCYWTNSCTTPSCSCPNGTTPQILSSGGMCDLNGSLSICLWDFIPPLQSACNYFHWNCCWTWNYNWSLITGINVDTGNNTVSTNCWMLSGFGLGAYYTDAWMNCLCQ